MEWTCNHMHIILFISATDSTRRLFDGDNIVKL